MIFLASFLWSVSKSVKQYGENGVNLLSGTASHLGGRVLFNPMGQHQPEEMFFFAATDEIKSALIQVNYRGNL